MIVTTIEALAAIESGLYGTYTVKAKSNDLADLETFQADARSIIDLARTLGVTHQVHSSDDTGLDLIDLVTVEVPPPV